MPGKGTDKKHGLNPGQGNTRCNRNFNYSEAFLSPRFQLSVSDCTTEMSLERSISRFHHKDQVTDSYVPAGSRLKVTQFHRQPLPQLSFPLSSHQQAMENSSLGGTLKCSSFWKRPSILAWKVPLVCKNMDSPHFWLVIHHLIANKNTKQRF